MDQLNTYLPALLHAAFPPVHAKRLAHKLKVHHLEIHHAPKHGSWLDVAGIELSLRQRQCPQLRIPDHAALTREAARACLCKTVV
ncbi:MAG: hypothetical protein M3Q10_05690 [Chloroflexota bacterium]|nr:hypothetical protein [Chloroflexota bacterium]